LRLGLSYWDSALDNLTRSLRGDEVWLVVGTSICVLRRADLRVGRRRPGGGRKSLLGSIRDVGARSTATAAENK
jgi:hypothetical protein